MVGRGAPWLLVAIAYVVLSGCTGSDDGSTSEPHTSTGRPAVDSGPAPPDPSIVGEHTRYVIALRNAGALDAELEATAVNNSTQDVELPTYWVLERWNGGSWEVVGFLGDGTPGGRLCASLDDCATVPMTRVVAPGESSTRTVLVGGPECATYRVVARFPPIEQVGEPLEYDDC